MENTGFNQESFNAFTPKISQEYNSKLVSGILLTSLAIIAGVLVYNFVKEIERKNAES